MVKRPVFAPLPDITTYELARLMKYITRPCDDESVEEMQPELKRHFAYKEFPAST